MNCVARREHECANSCFPYASQGVGLEPILLPKAGQARGLTMKFTKQSIAALSLPEGKTDAIVFDDALPGFGVRMRIGGKSVWIVQYRVGRKQRRETLGDLRKVELDAARTIAKIRLAEVALGGDPQAKKAESRVRAALTLGTVADRYLEFKKPALRLNSYNADRRYLAIHWKPLHGRPIDAIKRADVAARLAEIINGRGAVAAARARGTLSAFYAWAIREGIAEQNPVIGTNDPAIRVQPRDRVLDNDEMRAIWKACGDDDFGRIVRLLMLTGARRDEIGGLLWQEIDFEAATLSIPGYRIKNHRTLVLPLPPLALSILQSTPRREGREFLFGGSGGAFSAWSYSTLQLAARTGKAEGRPLAAWRIHDIRRTVATGMAEIGVQPHVIEAVLNHVSGHKAGVAGIYNRAIYAAEKTAALVIWAEHLRSIVEGGAQKVVPLRLGR
jgi:integrase